MARRRFPDDQVHLDFGQFVSSDSGNGYRMLQKLGAGGSADTYLMVGVNGIHNGNPVAVKFFRRLSKPHRREEFLREADFLRKCDHPGVMRIFDEGTHLGAHPFFVVEYLPQTIADVIRDGQSTIVEKLSWAVQLLNTLVFLNGLAPPVIHRDIKPQNVFVKGRSCVLGDFGLLKHELTATVPRSGQSKQSIGPGMAFRYRTPDLVAYARGNALPTTKSDVFQLGLVLAELFTGRNPQRPSQNLLSEVEMNPLRKVRGSHGEPISTLIDSMLKADVRQRPAADVLLDAWRGVFMTAAGDSHAANGKVF